MKSSAKNLVRLAAATASLVFAAPAMAQAAPCTQDPLFAQQDFTLGHWDVFDEKGKRAEVLMERVVDGCAIHEAWYSPDGSKMTGIGLFNYSRIRKSWTYAWASSRGSTSLFDGTLIEPGNMRFVTERPGDKPGTTRLRHWSLIALPDDRVRELSVATEDGGASWITEYDYIWVRKAGK